jgi:hypothetical protein
MCHQQLSRALNMVLALLKPIDSWTHCVRCTWLLERRAGGTDRCRVVATSSDWLDA